MYYFVGCALLLCAAIVFCESTEVREACRKRKEKLFSHELKSQADVAVVFGNQFLSAALQVVEVPCVCVFECVCVCACVLAPS